MAEEKDVGCARPTGGPVGEDQSEFNESPEIIKEEGTMVMVGHPISFAADFIRTSSYHM